MVLLDIAMPGLNGRDVARTLRQANSDDGGRALHIIAVTAVQPGLEEPRAAPATFAVTAYNGLSEEDFSTLLLLQAKASGIELKSENVKVDDGLS